MPTVFDLHAQFETTVRGGRIIVLAPLRASRTSVVVRTAASTAISKPSRKDYRLVDRSVSRITDSCDGDFDRHRRVGTMGVTSLWPIESTGNDQALGRRRRQIAASNRGKDGQRQLPTA